MAQYDDDFDHKSASAEDIFLNTKFLGNYLCSGIIQDFDKYNDQEKEVMNTKYVSCIFAGLSTRARKCFSKIPHFFEPSMNEEEYQLMSDCLEDKEIEEEFKTISSKMRTYPSRPRYKQLVQSLKDEELLKKHKESKESIVSVRCANSWQLCKNEIQELQKCLRTTENPAKCFREAANYDQCLTSAACYNEMRECMSKFKNEDEAFFMCADSDPKVKQCAMAAEETNDAMRSNAQLQLIQSTYASAIPKIVDSTPDALPMSKDGLADRMQTIMKEGCANEAQLLVKCKENMAENCDMLQKMLGICAFTHLCAKQLHKCMQTGKNFTQCFEDESVKRCMSRAMEVEKE